MAEVAAAAGDAPDLRHPRRVHVVGVGGTGMSAVAAVLAGMGHTVTGSDIKGSAAVDRLVGLGVRVWIGHDASHVQGADLVTSSTAVPDRNVELVEATREGIPVQRRAQTLAGICAIRPTLAVAGTHGKTTTSSMLALILVVAGMRPSYIIGGDIHEVGSGAVWHADGSWLVVEADESDGTFLDLGTRGVIVTSVEADHLEFYGSLQRLEAAFGEFLQKARGPRVVCLDDPVAARLGASAAPVLTYGTHPDAEYRMAELTTGRAGAGFDVIAGGSNLGRVDLAVPGEYNARNACAALAMAVSVGVDFDTARQALARYAGVARRFEFRGQRRGVTFVDDYGHLPSEVRAVLTAARAGHWERIVAVFQPHRYSRTAMLWADFADAFVDADVLVITDIYAAGELPRPGVNGQLIADAVRGAHPERDVRYFPTHDALVEELNRTLRRGDLCLTLGAGDLTLLPDELLTEGR
jgi:UDP-N-acetylmuramate--alanine ligase